MRRTVWLVAGCVAVTLRALPIYPSIPATAPALHWTQDAIAARITGARPLRLPLGVEAAVSQRRLIREDA